MAAQEIYYFTKYLQRSLTNGAPDLNTADLRVAMLSVVPNHSGDEYWSDISANQIVAATSYKDANAASGKVLSSITGVITAATATDPCVLTVTDNPYAVGAIITPESITGSMGTDVLNGVSFEVTAVSGDSVTIDVSASGKTYTSGGTTSSRLARSGTEIVFDAENLFWAYDASGATNAVCFTIHEYNATASLAVLVAFGEFDATQTLQNANGIGIALPSNGIGRS